MDPQNDFEFLKNSLEEFEYPGVSTFEAEQYAEVFHSSNRLFLLSWLLKKISSESELEFDNSPNKEDIIGQLLYENGFCVSSKIKNFLNAKMPLPEQLSIIRLMFQHLKDISKDENSDGTFVPVSVDDVLKLRSGNLNLFPCYGDISMMSEEDVEKKMNEYGSLWEDCDEEENVDQDNKENTEENEEEEEIVEEYKLVEPNEINPKESLKILFKIKENLASILPYFNKETNKKDAKTYDGKLAPEAKNLIENSITNLRKVTQYIQDVNVISDFLERESNSTGINLKLIPREKRPENVHKMLLEMRYAMKRFG